MKKILFLMIFISFVACNKDEMIDNESVKIGTQIWMVKNLNVDHYRNGDLIPEVKDSTEWASLKTGAWCYYNNNPSFGSTYQKLYNWYAINDKRGLAPKGWHVPSNSELKTLCEYLGGTFKAGGKLKETSTVIWKSPNEGATNASLFSAMPGGQRLPKVSYSLNEDLSIHINKDFGEVGYYGQWWSATQSGSDEAGFWYLSYENNMFESMNGSQNYGFSVRCIKDK